MSREQTVPSRTFRGPRGLCSVFWLLKGLIKRAEMVFTTLARAAEGMLSCVKGVHGSPPGSPGTAMASVHEVALVLRSGLQEGEFEGFPKLFLEPPCQLVARGLFERLLVRVSFY